MGDYHWTQVAMLLLDKIDNMKAHEEEMNNRINELMAENVRLHQIINEREVGAK